MPSSLEMDFIFKRDKLIEWLLCQKNSTVKDNMEKNARRIYYVTNPKSVYFIWAYMVVIQLMLPLPHLPRSLSPRFIY